MPTYPKTKLGSLIFAALLMTGCDSFSSGSKTKSANTAPTSHAGANLNVDEQSTVTLIGYGVDSIGDELSYHWTQKDGPSVNFEDASQSTTHFESPTVLMSDGVQSVTLTLTVTDQDGLSHADDMVVTVNPVNSAPAIEPIATTMVAEGDTLVLPATVTDVDGSISNYDWHQISGSAVQLTNSGTATASITTSAVIDAQDIELELTVTDNEGATASQQFSLKVTPKQLINTTEKLVLDDSGLAFAPRLIHSADLDGDGNNDLIVLQNNVLNWYRNDNKEQLEQSLKILPLTSNHSDIEALHSDDIDGDGDGDIDLLTISLNSSPRIGWIENLGQGNFSGINAIDEEPGHSFGSRITFTDLDNDGNKDILAFYDTQLLWHKQLSPGVFGQRNVIADQRLNEAVFVDFDNDGDIDALSMYSTDKQLILFTNNGGGHFSRSIVYDGTSGGTFGSISSVDMDKNGLMDFIITSYDPTVTIILNNGTQGTSVVKLDAHALPTSPTEIEAADFDGDEDIDIAFTSKSNKEVWLWRHSGEDLVGNFENITTATSHVNILHASDLTNDGRKELVMGSKVLANLSMAKFNTDTQGTQIVPITKSLNDSGITQIQNINISDFNADGQNDVVIQSSDPGKLILLNGLGDGNLSDQHVMVWGSHSLRGLAVDDFNGDGLIDIITAPGNGYYGVNMKQEWLALNNIGANRFEQIVAVPSEQSEYVNSMTQADIDGDGDLDIITARSTWPVARLVWFENDGSNHFTRHVLMENWSHINHVVATDMDGDGDQDIVFEAYHGSEYKIYWLRNNTLTDWQLAGPIDSHTYRYSQLHVTHFDDNNTNDIVGVHNGGISIVKSNGNGNFQAPYLFPSGQGTHSIDFVDIDNDNDLDMVTLGNSALNIFEGAPDSELIQTESHELQSRYQNAKFITGDIDNDGDKDIMLSSGHPNFVAWFENYWINGVH